MNPDHQEDDELTDWIADKRSGPGINGALTERILRELQSPPNPQVAFTRFDWGKAALLTLAGLGAGARFAVFVYMLVIP